MPSQDTSLSTKQEATRRSSEVSVTRVAYDFVMFYSLVLVTLFIVLVLGPLAFVDKVFKTDLQNRLILLLVRAAR